MLTKSEIRQLEKIFPTKKDIKGLEKRIEKKFVTNDHFNKTIEELINFITVTQEAAKKEIIGELGDFKKEVRQFAKEISSILQNHEGRIRKLESKSSLN